MTYTAQKKTSIPPRMTPTAEEITSTAQKTAIPQDLEINPHLLAVDSTSDTHPSTSQLQSPNIEMQQIPGGNGAERGGGAACESEDSEADQEV
jgi:hypothetical protein